VILVRKLIKSGCLVMGPLYGRSTFHISAIRWDVLKVMLGDSGKAAQIIEEPQEL